MGDLNCSIGSVLSNAIGEAGSEIEDEGGECLRELCNDFQFALPCTSDVLHCGEHWTHQSVQGTRARLDYIVTPADCISATKSSYIDDEIDVLNGDRDHRVVALEVGIIETNGMKFGTARKPLYDREAASRAKRQGRSSLLEDLPLCDWNADVNKHWSIVRDHLQVALSRSFPKQKRQKRQLYFSQKAWDLVCYRKELRQEHRELQRDNVLAQLFICFRAWKDGSCDTSNGFFGIASHVNRLQEALVLQMRQKVDLEFRKLKKQEWKQWVKAQLEERISQKQHAKASDVYRILKPKKIIDTTKGKQHRPLPGLKDQSGKWRSSKTDIAFAWEQQFAQIEIAEQVDFDHFLQRSSARGKPYDADILQHIPSLYEFEHCLKSLKENKAPGLDGIGAEVWQMDVAAAAMRAHPMVLKCALRQQSIPELTGGWLLPLYKGKGSPSLMSGYRAILLEPTLARAISRSWRSRLVDGLERVAAPTQHGGRKGLGIEPLHLMLRMWHSNAAAARKSIGIAFLDVKSAFYRVVKDMLAKFNGTADSLASIFRDMKLPDSAYQSFLVNVGASNLVETATGSEIVAGHVASSLSHTWFMIPNGQCVQAPRTGSRPGDPCADILFGFVMSHILKDVTDRAALEGINLQTEVAGRITTNYVTWVDDIAISVIEDAGKVVQTTTNLFSIVIDVMTEHAMTMSYGKGKTAAMFTFHGKHAVRERQHFESAYKDALPVWSEHLGVINIPVVGHYKHLGGMVVANGYLLPEIKTRGAMMKQNVSPLKSILCNQRFQLAHRRMLLRSLGLSVVKLHCGTWFAMRQGEVEAWQAVVFQTYQLLEKRADDGTVPHKELFDLAAQANAPMPMEWIYIERLRLLVHMIQVCDKYVVNAVLENYHVAGKES